MFIILLILVIAELTTGYHFKFIKKYIHTSTEKTLSYPSISRISPQQVQNTIDKSTTGMYTYV
jgi:hypothetical protein